MNEPTEGPKLEPCPFLTPGPLHLVELKFADKTVRDDGSVIHSSWWVQCSCGARGPLIYNPDSGRWLAAEGWNARLRRATHPPASGERERVLEEALRAAEAAPLRPPSCAPDEKLVQLLTKQSCVDAIYALKDSPPVPQPNVRPLLEHGPSPLPWRCGRSVGRTIYDAHDRLIGLMDSRQDAAVVVAAIRSLAASQTPPGGSDRG